MAGTHGHSGQLVLSRVAGEDDREHMCARIHHPSVEGPVALGITWNHSRVTATVVRVIFCIIHNLL